MKYSIIILALLLFLVSISLSQSAEKRIAVINLNATGVSLTESLTFTDRLRSELVNTHEFKVIERDKMDEILKEQGLQQSGCTTNECAVEIGRLLNINQICAGSVGKVGSLYTVTLRLIDVETGQIITTVTEDCNCPIETVLTYSIRNIALKLVDASKIGILRFVGLIVGSDVSIDGKKITEGNLEFKVPLGNHIIEAKKSGFKDFSKQINIQDEKIYTVDLALNPKTKSEALIRSVLIPGWGQAYQEKTVQTWLYPLAIIACGAGSFYITMDYNKKIHDYNEIEQEYRNAFDSNEINSLFQQMNDAYNKVEKSEKFRNELFITTGVLWLWNMMDTLFLPPAWGKSFKVSANTYGNKISLGLSLSLS